MKKVIKKIFLLLIVLLILLSNYSIMADETFEVEEDGPNNIGVWQIDHGGIKRSVTVKFGDNLARRVDYKIWNYDVKKNGSITSGTLTVENAYNTTTKFTGVPIIYYAENDKPQLLISPIFTAKIEEIWFICRGKYTEGSEIDWSHYSDYSVNWDRIDNWTRGDILKIGDDRWCSLTYDSGANTSGYLSNDWGSWAKFIINFKKQNNYTGIPGFELWIMDKDYRTIPIAIFRYVLTYEAALKEFNSKSFDEALEESENTNIALLNWLCGCFGGGNESEIRSRVKNKIIGGDSNLQDRVDKIKDADEKLGRSSDESKLYWYFDPSNSSSAVESADESIERLREALKKLAIGLVLYQDPDLAIDYAWDTLQAIVTDVTDRNDRISNLTGPIGGEPRDPVTHEDVVENVSDWRPDDKMTGDGKDKLEEMGSKILSVISGVGMVTAVIIVAILGIKYMLGSVDEKAEFKKDMVPYLVGSGLLFGITAIVNVLSRMGNVISLLT